MNVDGSNWKRHVCTPLPPSGETGNYAIASVTKILLHFLYPLACFYLLHVGLLLHGQASKSRMDLWNTLYNALNHVTVISHWHVQGLPVLCSKSLFSNTFMIVNWHILGFQICKWRRSWNRSGPESSYVQRRSSHCSLQVWFHYWFVNCSDS
jgi:hypothetical protein